MGWGREHRLEDVDYEINSGTANGVLDLGRTLMLICSTADDTQYKKQLTGNVAKFK